MAATNSLIALRKRRSETFPQMISCLFFARVSYLGSIEARGNLTAPSTVFFAWWNGHGPFRAVLRRIEENHTGGTKTI